MDRRSLGNKAGFYRDFRQWLTLCRPPDLSLMMALVSLAVQVPLTASSAVPQGASTKRQSPKIVRLPTVSDTDSPRQPTIAGVRLASTPRQLSEPLLPESLQPEAPVNLPPGTRQGVFQKIFFTGTWLPRSGANGLGLSNLDLGLSLGLPCPSRDSPLLVTPSFEAYYIDSPPAADLPPRLYDASIELRWLRRLGKRWATDLVVTPGMHGDFKKDNADALRITGRGLAVFDRSPTTRIVLGVIYLDRSDISVLPAAGLFWTPTDDWRLELLVPQPRIAHRIEGFPNSNSGELWAYIAGELGGGVWAIEQASGNEEVMTINDFRLSLGLDRKVPGEVSRRFEIGYVFERKVDFKGSTPDLYPNDTLMVRLGTSY